MIASLTYLTSFLLEVSVRKVCTVVDMKCGKQLFVVENAVICSWRLIGLLNKLRDLLFAAPLIFL